MEIDLSLSSADIYIYESRYNHNVHVIRHFKSVSASILILLVFSKVSLAEFINNWITAPMGATQAVVL